MVCKVCFARYDDNRVRCEAEGALLLTVDTKDPRSGLVIDGRTILIDVLGEGGMGTVYRAHQPSLDRDVAVKILDAANDEELVKRFDQEAKVLAKLRSNHITIVYDHGRLPSGEMYIAMELAEGRTLSTFRRPEGIKDIDWIIDVIDQICVGLELAHDNGIIHRDIKPSNVIVGEQYVKVLDFGLAKLVRRRGKDNVSSARLLIGTAEYMPPEMWDPEKWGDPSSATDIYGLGILMYELVEGRRPFEADSDAGYMTRHINDTAPSLPVGHPLAEIVAKCLRKEQEARFESATALRSALAALAMPARPAPRRHVRRWLLLATPATVAALAIAELPKYAARPIRAVVSDVRVKSEPPGAVITIDGEPTGLVTPAVMRMYLTEPRTIELAAANDGRSKSNTIEVGPGRSVEADLELDTP